MSCADLPINFSPDTGCCFKFINLYNYQHSPLAWLYKEIKFRSPNCKIDAFTQCHCSNYDLIMVNKITITPPEIVLMMVKYTTTVLYNFYKQLGRIMHPPSQKCCIWGSSISIFAFKPSIFNLFRTCVWVVTRLLANSSNFFMSPWLACIFCVQKVWA